MTFVSCLSRGLNAWSSSPGLAATIAVATLGVAYGQGTGVVSGRVTDESGKTTVAAAEVYLHGKKKVFLAKTISSAAGTYRFDTVPDGEYEVCATPTAKAAADYLNSCVWDRVANPATIQQGVRTVDIELRLRKAAKIQVNVTDPQARLETNQAQGGKRDAMHVSLWTREHTQFPMHLANSARNAKTFEALVPFDTEVLIGIAGTPLQVEVEGTRFSTNSGKSQSIRVDSKKETSKSVAVLIVGGAQ